METLFGTISKGNKNKGEGKITTAATVAQHFVFSVIYLSTPNKMPIKKALFKCSAKEQNLETKTK